RAGADVSGADYADLVRQRVAGTVAAFYDVLEAQSLLDLARQDEADLKKLEQITKDRVKAGGAGAIDEDRARLAVLDSERDVRKRSAALITARATLRAQLGRADIGPEIEVAGHLDTSSLNAPPALSDLVALAEQFRPDI